MHWSNNVAKLTCGTAFIAVASLGLAPLAKAQLAQGTQSKAPIEITSDQLTVDQDKQIATFTGNVDGVQGDATLKADVMRVYYVQQSANGQGTQDKTNNGAATSGSASGNQNIRRIEADGNVIISQPDQNATGDHGVYEVPEAKVTLIGNVVITNKGNVVRGGRAVMDMNTNISTVYPAETGKTPTRTQRVRAVFQNDSANGASSNKQGSQ
ncbi:lipopolysaccharide export system protein LptA [Arboricoccus pini]|uniref:Lipopolysaccharide export system protein LptA n=1 Tax=Arboricoccus pini TaxID=1963835 RepID=A0A212QZR8_9PROT|nr:LptA/OstA family protein [Arboricoccus pini]SNB65199.1 lipopolysaccharide export system protein LptA [Arboricoccus pini]